MVHHGQTDLPVTYTVRCPCGLNVDCSATSDAEACADIDHWLDGDHEVTCAACRAMPAA